MSKKTTDSEKQQKKEQKRAEKQKALKAVQEAKQQKKLKEKLQKDGKTPKESQKIKNIRAKVQKALKEGKNPTQRKVWTNVIFRRPKTLRNPKAPKYPKSGVTKRNKMDKYAVLKHPLNSESVMRAIEDQNTLIFITDVKASKKQIRNAFKRMYDVKVDKVRTLIRPTGEKKAFIKLAKEGEALEVANKIGVI